MPDPTRYTSISVTRDVQAAIAQLQREAAAEAGRDVKLSDLLAALVALGRGQPGSLNTLLTWCRNDTDGDGDCAFCARDPQLLCPVRRAQTQRAQAQAHGTRTGRVAEDRSAVEEIERTPAAPEPEAEAGYDLDPRAPAPVNWYLRRADGSQVAHYQTEAACMPPDTDEALAGLPPGMHWRLYIAEHEGQRLFDDGVAGEAPNREGWPEPAEAVTKTGRVLTPADLDELVAEAEVGYDVEQLKDRKDPKYVKHEHEHTQHPPNPPAHPHTPGTFNEALRHARRRADLHEAQAAAAATRAPAPRRRRTLAEQVAVLNTPTTEPEE